MEVCAMAGIKGRLQIKDRLARRMKEIDVICPLCRKEKESIQYLFFKFPVQVVSSKDYYSGKVLADRAKDGKKKCIWLRGIARGRAKVQRYTKWY